MSDSPRTDKASWRQHDTYLGGERELVTADFARTLERENAQLIAEGDNLHAKYRELDAENAMLRESLHSCINTLISLGDEEMSSKAHAALKGEGG